MIGGGEPGVAQRERTRKALTEAAHEEVEEEEDEHLYHTTGWSTGALGSRLSACRAAGLPPPEEKKDVKTAIGAARAKKARKSLL